MKSLATIVVQMLEVLSSSDEDGLDGQTCDDMVGAIWASMAETSPAERDAVAKAAKELMDEMQGGDEDDVDSEEDEEEVNLPSELLKSLIDRSAYEELDADEEEDD